MCSTKQKLGSTFSIDRGSEGPHHDPYGYEEITFTKRDGREMTLHMGLGTWLKVDGKQVPFTEEKELYEWFEQFIGVTLKVFEKAVRRIENPTKCRNCGCKKFYYSDGFPGESFELCCKCNHMVSYHFNESAII